MFFNCIICVKTNFTNDSLKMHYFTRSGYPIHAANCVTLILLVVKMDDPDLFKMDISYLKSVRIWKIE